MAIVSTHGINSLPHGAPQPYFPDDRYPDGVMTFTEIPRNNYVMMDRNLDYKWPDLYIESYGTYPNDVMKLNYPAACYYNFDEDTYGINGRDYGLMYNKSAVDYLREHPEIFGPADSHGYRWHIPLQNELNAFMYGLNGLNAKSTTYWITPGTNSSGLNIKPSGTVDTTEFSADDNVARFPYYDQSYYYQCFLPNNGSFTFTSWGRSGSQDNLINIRLIKHI